jgi:hypothetical protein
MVSRIDDDSFNADQIDTRGQFFFNKNSTRVGMSAIAGQVRIYNINPSTGAVIGTGWGLDNMRDTVSGALIPQQISTVWWDKSAQSDAERTVFYAYQMLIYRVNVVEDAGVFHAVKVVDMTTEYSGGYFERCSAANDTYRFFCAVIDGTHGGGGKLAYYVVDILSPAPSNPATNYTIRSKFKNGVDSANWWQPKTTGPSGLWQLASLFAAVTTIDGPYVVNGYKGSIDRSGLWIIHSLNDQAGCSSPSPTICGVHTRLAGPWNSLAIENVADGTIRYAHGVGHLDPGIERISTSNGSDAGPCLTQPKYFVFSALTNSTSFAVNGGTCLLTAVAPSGFGWYVQYASRAASGDWATHTQACGTGLCPNAGAFLDEVFNLNEVTGEFDRIVRMHHNGSGGIEYLQPMQNSDGSLIAFESNLGGETHVYIVKK